MRLVRIFILKMWTVRIFILKMWIVRILKCGIGERPRVLSEECGDPPAYDRRAAAVHLLPQTRLKLKVAPHVLT